MLERGFRNTNPAFAPPSVFLLIGFRNRVAVMGQWVWAYTTREGNSPLITDHQQAEVGSTRTTHPSAPAWKKGID